MSSIEITLIIVLIVPTMVLTYYLLIIRSAFRSRNAAVQMTDTVHGGSEKLSLEQLANVLKNHDQSLNEMHIETKMFRNELESLTSISEVEIDGLRSQIETLKKQFNAHDAALKASVDTHISGNRSYVAILSSRIEQHEIRIARMEDDLRTWRGQYGNAVVGSSYGNAVRRNLHEGPAKFPNLENVVDVGNPSEIFGHIGIHDPVSYFGTNPLSLADPTRTPTPVDHLTEKSAKKSTRK